MGLLSGIAGGLFGAAGSIIGAASSAKATKKAANAQLQATQMAIDEQRRQYDTSRADYQPYLSTGLAANDAIAQLLGLGTQRPGAATPGIGEGNPVTADMANAQFQQQSAIDALRGSPLYQSLFRNGQEAVLQNAAATGGIRGGNTQGALYNLGQDTLSSVIQQQLANLSAVSAQGAGSTAQIANLGANSSANIGGLLQQQGNQRAGSILGQQAIYNNLSQSLQKQIMSAFGGGGGGF